MKKLSNLSSIAVSANEMSNIKGGTFFQPRYSSCAPAPVYNGCGSTNYGSSPNYGGGCAPVQPVCAPVIALPTFCLPKISFSFGFGCGW